MVALRYLALLRVPRPHHLPGHIILDYRQLVPRRPLYPNRARNSVGLAFERSTREAGTGSIHRGYNRYFPELGGHLWLQNALAAVLVLSTLPETILSKKIDGSREFDRVQRIKPDCHLHIIFSCVEHVLSSDTNTIRAQPTHPSYISYPVGPLLYRSWDWLPTRSRELLRWSLDDGMTVLSRNGLGREAAVSRRID